MIFLWNLTISGFKYIPIVTTIWSNSISFVAQSFYQWVQNDVRIRCRSLVWWGKSELVPWARQRGKGLMALLSVSY